MLQDDLSFRPELQDGHHIPNGHHDYENHRQVTLEQIRTAKFERNVIRMHLPGG